MSVFYKKIYKELTIVKSSQNSDAKKPAGAVTVDGLLAHSNGSIFFLARIAMLRALEIHGGSRPLIDHGSSEKATSIALREIAQGKIAFKNHSHGRR